MPIENIEVLFPGDDREIPPAEFVVTSLTDGMFSVSGPDSMVHFLDETHIQFDTPLVTDHGDGTYTAVSG